MADVLAWIDVETTGLNAQEHYLLEVACILTDTNLNVLEDEPFCAVIYYGEDDRRQLRDEADPHVQQMHDATGLWRSLPSGTPIRDVDRGLLAYISKHAPEPRQARVAGNSVRLDLNFLDDSLPATAAHLHYRFVDVTGINYILEENGLYSDQPLPDSDHVALNDIQRSIAQLRQSLDYLRLHKRTSTRHSSFRRLDDRPDVR